MLTGNWNVVALTWTGVPTVAVTPAGSWVKSRAAAVTVAGWTASEKVTVRNDGADVSVLPVASGPESVATDRTVNRLIALMALGALTMPKPPWTFHVAGADPFSGVADATSAERISDRVAVGRSCSISAATA